MLRSAALSRISFEQNDADWERALRKSFGGNELRREGSGVSQTSQDDEEWENWREEHPCALHHFDQLAAEAAGKLVAVFLDYDGTLTPIVSNPDAAFMPEQSREAVRRVAELFPTAIVSGRGREKVESFVQLRQLFYAGSHGMDIVGPRSSGSSSSGGGSPGAGSSATTSRTQSGECGDAAGTAAGTAVNGAAVASEAAAAVASRSADAAENEERFTFQPAAQYEPLMNAVYDELTVAVAPFPGSSVEHNKFCVSVHFRNCTPEDYPGVLAATERVAGAHPQLHITRGRKVLEVRPQVDWDKGAALAHLLSSMGLDDPQQVYALYIGDDRTDEDAFRVLAERGLGSGILVSTRVKPTAGRWTLRDPTEVAAFLNRLVAWGRSGANRWHEVGSCVGWRIAASSSDHQQAAGGVARGPTSQQLLLAAMDGFCVQPQQCVAGLGRSHGSLSAANALQRPPLPPKSGSLRSGSLLEQSALQQVAAAGQPAGQQHQQHWLQQQHALGEGPQPNGSAAPAACSGAAPRS